MTRLDSPGGHGAGGEENGGPARAVWAAGGAGLDEQRRADPGIGPSASTALAANGPPMASGGEFEALPDMRVLRLHRRLPPPPPLEALGARWAAWIGDAAKAAACPPDYVLAPLLAAASALVGNARWAQAQAGWAEPPHLWCASVGDSGGGKSPGADATLGRVLPEIERRMALGFPERLREHQLAAELAKMRKEAWEDGARQAHRRGHTPPERPSVSGS